MESPPPKKIFVLPSVSVLFHWACVTSALASTGFFSHSSRLRFFFSAMRLKKLCIHLARIQKLTADINGVGFGVECIDFEVWVMVAKSVVCLLAFLVIGLFLVRGLLVPTVVPPRKCRPCRLMAR